MKQQISNIVIAVIISGTALYGLGAFEKKEMTYATVHFDGGFKKIGEIAEQRAFSKVKVTMGESEIYSGDIATVTSEIKQALAGEENPNDMVWKDGVNIKGNVGVSWIGSESRFELTTDTIDLTSTEKAPLKPLDIVVALETMDSTIKARHQEYAEEALSFSENPESSFLLSRILDALRS